MNKNDLFDLLRNGENSGVEFKRDDVEPRALAKEIVALANLRGGRVLLGVEDDGTISGTQRPDLEEWVMTVCRDKIRPELTPYFEMILHETPPLREAESGILPGDTGSFHPWGIPHPRGNPLDHQSGQIESGDRSR